jgi:hypothetical protein
MDPENYQIIREIVRDDELDKNLSLLEIKQALNKMKPNKSPGNDGISNEFLVNLPDNALIAIQKALNDVFNSGDIPESWINSDIKMLHKKGDPENPHNYRPIALENCSFKLLINARLMQWVEKNNALPEY